MTDSKQFPGPVRDWKGHAWRLGLVLLLAVGVRAWTVTNTTLVSRDCVKFVRDALHLEQPPVGSDRLDFIKSAEHPPGYPAAILAMSKLVRLRTGGVTVETMALSAQLVSAIAGVLLVFPLYFLISRAFDRNTACSAATLFMALPVCVEVTSDGISDGLFLLTAAWAMWFAVRALEQDRPRGAWWFGLGAGLCCGLGYLVRPDAAIVAAAIGLTFAGVLVRRRRGGDSVRPPFMAGLGLVVGTLALAGPYVALIGKLTNKPSGNQFIEQMQGKDGKPTYFQRSQLGTGRVPFASWWDPAEAGEHSKAVWALEAVGAEYWKSVHYSLVIFTVIGLFVVRRRLDDARVVLLLVLAGVHLVVLWQLAWRVGYVSQRHTLLTVMISCVLAATAFPALGVWAVQLWHTRTLARTGLRVFASLAGRYRARQAIHRLRAASPWLLGTIWTLLLLSPALPRDFYSLHAERAGHKAAGRWIADQGDPQIELVDPFGWAEWYAGRSLREAHTPSPYDGRPKYAVFEPNAKSPHSRLEYYEYARFLKEHALEMPFQYPPDAPTDEIKVAVYLYKPSKK
jgi:hypothetical protein